MRRENRGALCPEGTRDEIRYFFREARRFEIVGERIPEGVELAQRLPERRRTNWDFLQRPD